jgi:prepilin-type N-terminal cleavage/methylation domain-containing protein
MTRSTLARVRRVLRRESGFTLLEVTITAALLGIVIVAILAIADTGQNLAPKDQERAHAIREAQTGLHGMTRELRQAQQVVAATPSSMTVRVPIDGTETTVTYRCDEPHPTNDAYTRCVRDGDSGTRMVVDRLQNGASVFEYTRNPTSGAITYVRAKVDVPAAGDLKGGHPHHVVLDDGFYMRNLDL